MIDHSFEKSYLEHNYERLHIIPTPSNERAIELVRDGQAEAAVMNAMTAAWYKDVILTEDVDSHQRLSFVGRLEMQIPLLIAYPRPTTESIANLWLCIDSYWAEVGFLQLQIQIECDRSV